MSRDKLIPDHLIPEHARELVERARRMYRKGINDEACDAFDELYAFVSRGAAAQAAVIALTAGDCELEALARSVVRQARAAPDHKLAHLRATQVLSELERIKSLDAPKRRSRRNEKPTNRELEQQRELERKATEAKASLEAWAREHPDTTNDETTGKRLARRLRNFATIEFESLTVQESIKLRDDLYAIAAEVEEL